MSASNRIEIDGIEVHESGSGAPVVVLQTKNQTPIIDQLAKHFRVIMLVPRRDLQINETAAALHETAGKRALSKYSLISGSEFAPAAIAHAIESGDAIEALVLEAPSDAGTDGVTNGLPLDQLKVPTLVLAGTRDEEAAETGRNYARRISNCYYTLVYDAGRDIAADRPEAVCSLISDFLERREKFALPRESSAINA